MLSELWYDGGMGDVPRPDEPPRPDEVSQLLNLVNGQADGTDDALFPVVYEQLRALAGSYFRGQPANHTLQPTALVHEALLKVLQAEPVWQDRAHFCAVAARAMRQVLINHARAKKAGKRDARRIDVTVDGLEIPRAAETIDLIMLDEALTSLAEVNEKGARLVELRYFGGLEVADIARMRGVSESIVRRSLRAAYAWIRRELSTA